MNVNQNEPIIDAMLDEWLNQRKPSSLSVQSLRTQVLDPQRAAELEQALMAAKGTAKNRSVLAPASRYRKSKSNASAYRIIASLAACLVIGLGFWSGVFQNASAKFAGRPSASTSIVLQDHPQASKIAPKNDPARGSVEPAPANGSSVATSANPVPTKGGREALPMDSLPFGASDSGGRHSMIPKNHDRTIKELDDKELIAILDQKTRDLWKNYDAKPAAPLKSTAWVDRVTQQVLSRPATPLEKDTLAKKDDSASRLNWMHRLVESDELRRFGRGGWRLIISIRASRWPAVYLPNAAPLCSGFGKSSTVRRSWIR